MVVVEEEEGGGRSFTDIMISILLLRLLSFYSLVIRDGGESTLPCWHTANTQRCLLSTKKAKIKTCIHVDSDPI